MSRKEGVPNFLKHRLCLVSVDTASRPSNQACNEEPSVYFLGLFIYLSIYFAPSSSLSHCPHLEDASKVLV